MDKPSPVAGHAPARTGTSSATAARGAGPRLDRWIMLGLFALAIGVRLTVVHSSGGFRTLMGYDDGVYFSATTGLLHGLLPYRDFVLLHPPGIMLLAAGPVAVAHALGLTDADTLVAVRVLVVALGGVNAVLTFTAGRHLSRSAGVAAASLYCVWGPVVREERTLLLEPFVILATLTALTLIPPRSARDVSGRWRPLLAGAVAGVGVTTKMWAVVPALVIAASLLVAGRWRRAVAFGATTAAFVLAVMAPFVALAPGRVWQLVVASQLGRSTTPESRLARFAEMGNLSAWPFSVLSNPSWPPLHPISPAVAQVQLAHSGRMGLLAGGVVALVIVLAVVAARRLPPARVWVALLVTQSLVLLTTPVFFDGYASFVAPAGMLLLGAGAHMVWNCSPVRGTAIRRPMVAAVAGVVTVLVGWGAVMTDRGAAIRPSVAPLVASARCVASDSPAMLALVDRLSRNLANGCPPVIDFSGIAYTLDHPSDAPLSPTAFREQSPLYQRFVQDYFAQADYVILRRQTATGISQETMAGLAHRPLVHTRPRVFGPPGSQSLTPSEDPGAQPEDDDDAQTPD